MKEVALVFCSEMHGHRQSYAAVIARVLASKGVRVCVAYPDDTTSSSLTIVSRAQQLGYLTALPFPSDKTSLVDACVALESQVDADITVFANGDEACPRLTGLAQATKRPVRRVAFFIDFTHLYGPKTLSGGTAFRWRRWASSSLRKEIYLRRTVPQDVGIDRFLTSQPRCFSLPRSKKWVQVPEIYRAWGFEEQETPATQALTSEIMAFRESNAGRDILPYYGYYLPRKGYDDLLRMAAENDRYAVLFLGRWGNDEDGELMVEERARLKEQGRLAEWVVPFGGETDAVEAAFCSGRIMPLPYKRHYNLSGIMIQACSYGKPVVVPNVGWMGDETKRQNLGWVYRHGSYASFAKTLDAAYSGCDEYAGRCKAFADRHRWEAVEKEYADAILG